MDALSPERLEDLRPPWDEHTKGTWRSRKWYNEAPRTAASILVSVAQESRDFREEFVNRETVMVPTFPEEDDSSMVEKQKWRQTLKDEFPEYHEQFNSIPLSAFQGGHAEQLARRQL